MQSTMRRTLLQLGLCLFAASAATVWAADPKDPRIGEWKLNLEKSKFSPGPAPKSLMIHFHPAGKGIHLTTKQVAADGKESGTEYKANYDGKDVPIKGSATADTVSMKRIDAQTTERIDKKAGKTVGTFRSVVSKDGKTYTVDYKGTNAKGEPVNNHLVFERP